MSNEYIIINKTSIQKRIEEWESELQECLKKSFVEFDSNYIFKLEQAIATARDFLSQSTPLIPEIEKAFDEGSFYGEDFINDEILKKGKQDYITNLKLDI